jgi:hypothetical protein
MSSPESSDPPEERPVDRADGGFPWYVKAAILAALLVIALVIVVDVLALAGAL